MLSIVANLQGDCEACTRLAAALKPHLVDLKSVMKFHRVLDVTTSSSSNTNCFTKVLRILTQPFWNFESCGALRN
jgi:hypothetical protein